MGHKSMHGLGLLSLLDAQNMQRNHGGLGGKPPEPEGGAGGTGGTRNTGTGGAGGGKVFATGAVVAEASEKPSGRVAVHLHWQDICPAPLDSSHVPLFREFSPGPNPGHPLQCRLGTAQVLWACEPGWGRFRWARLKGAFEVSQSRSSALGTTNEAVGPSSTSSGLDSHGLWGLGCCHRAFVEVQELLLVDPLQDLPPQHLHPPLQGSLLAPDLEHLKPHNSISGQMIIFHKPTR